ncbi:MAG: hypothetical protein R2861_11445 [Desulfobacterales bacterium]
MGKNLFLCWPETGIEWWRHRSRRAISQECPGNGHPRWDKDIRITASFGIAALDPEGDSLLTTDDSSGPLTSVCGQAK